MALTTIGLTTLKFGTADFSSSVVKSFEETIKCEPVELMGGSGVFQAVAITNPQSTMSMTIVSGGTSTSVGALISASANTFLTGVQGSLFVESASRTYTNDGFAEVQVSAVGYLNLGAAS
jgi:hypothetical protein